MRIIKILCLLAIFTSLVNAQPNLVWRRSFSLGGTGFISWPVDLVIDHSANVFVTGIVHGAHNRDNNWVTIKYDSVGNEEWAIIYDGSGNDQDQSTSIATDGFGDVYVTGFSWDSTTGFDYTTIKYSPEGDQLWITKYNGPINGEDKASDIFVDANNDVFITGTSAGVGTLGDFTTVKYNSEGIEQWVARYNGTADSTDRAVALEVDSTGNVFVAGYSFDIDTKDDYVTVKYSPAGVEQWVVRYNGMADSTDILTALYLDDASNVYVTGYSYDLTNMKDFATIKYDSSGVEQWVARFNGHSNKDDVARALVVGSSNDVFVTGSSYSNDTNYDYATIKYNTDGEEQWVATYNGSIFPYSTDYPEDRAIDIAVDNSNSVYVTGYSSDITADRSLIETIKYDSDGEKMWLLEEGSNTRNWVYGIEVDDSSNIYLVYASAAMTFSAITTVKYAQNIVAVRDEEFIPAKYSLSQNHPNPFNPMTTISYTLLHSGDVTLIIYNLLGKEIARLVDGFQQAGEHNIAWNATNISSGIYFYRLHSGDFTETKKMVLLK